MGAPVGGEVVLAALDGEVPFVGDEAMSEYTIIFKQILRVRQPVRYNVVSDRYMNNEKKNQLRKSE